MYIKKMTKLYKIKGRRPSQGLPNRSLVQRKEEHGCGYNFKSFEQPNPLDKESKPCGLNRIHGKEHEQKVLRCRTQLHTLLPSSKV